MSNYLQTFHEMTMAAIGDYEIKGEIIGTYSPIDLKKNYKVIGKLKSKKTHKTYTIYRSEYDIIAGEIDDDLFYEVLHMEYTIDDDPKWKHIGIKEVLSVLTVRTAENRQGDGIGLAFYEFIVNEMGYAILGDNVQFFGARRLWSRLSKLTTVIVDIIDIDNMEILYKDIEIKQGKMEDDYDERLWSLDFDKDNIRSLLRKIK